ncbi:MAG: PD40 domain-containing protein [Candidatus Coatesbacteria bacterium]|nr:PD40 domain-containing protein [Candidatus Coatesbacteria bacterium]
MYRILVILLIIPTLLSALEFGVSKIQYKYFNWQITETAHFKIFYYKGEEKLIPRFVDILEQAYHELSIDFKHNFKEKIQIVLYRSPSEFRQTNIINEDIGQSIGGFTEFIKRRVVVPFNGSYEDFRHVTKHELVHAFMYDMLFAGRSLGMLVKLELLGRIPLWYTEGIAEHLSVVNEVESEMVMRDAAIHNYMIPLREIDYYGGYLLYKEGQWFHRYLEENYGREMIFKILRDYSRRQNFEKVLEENLQSNMDYIERDFERWMKRQFWDAINKRLEPDEISRQLTDHTKDRSSFNIAPSISPDGKHIAFLTNWKQYADIYLMKVADGKLVRRIARTETSGEFQDFDFLSLKLSWSQDGKYITFIAGSKGADWIYIMDPFKSRVVNRYKTDCDASYMPSFSNSGDKIVYRGIKEGKADLYILDLKTAKHERKTFDFYDDTDPIFDNDDKYIVFSSDRGGKGYDLYKYEIESGKITTLVSLKGDEKNPCLIPDRKGYLFTNDGNGIRNLALTDITGKATYCVTNVLGGNYLPTTDAKFKDLVYYSYDRGGWNIYVLKHSRLDKIKEEWNKEITKLNPSAVVAKKEVPTSPVVKPDEKGKEPPKKDDKEKRKDTEFEDNMGRENPRKDLLVKKDPALNKPFLYPVEYIIPEKEEADQEFPYKLRARKYTPSFSIDYLTALMSYDTIFGLGGQALFAISDFLGNHQIYIITGMQGQVTDIAAQIQYYYLPHRIDLGVIALHQNEYYYLFEENPEDDIYFSDRTVGGGLNLRYPLNRYVKIDMSMISRYIRRDFYQPREDEGKIEDVVIQTPSLSLTEDTSLWNYFGPINGRRLGAEISFAYGKDIEFTSLQVDMRKYANINHRYAFAFRIAAGGSMGKTPQYFYLGGNIPDTGLLGALDDKGKLDFKNFYLNKGEQLRGYDYFEFNGHYYGLFNTEFRFPFIDYLLIRFPLPMLFSPIGGVIFTDLGGTFNKAYQFKGAEEGRLKDLKFGFGMGPRVGLGFLTLKMDWSWHSDFKSVSSPYFYFTLGGDF